MVNPDSAAREIECRRQGRDQDHRGWRLDLEGGGGGHGWHGDEEMTLECKHLSACCSDVEFAYPPGALLSTPSLL